MLIADNLQDQDNSSLTCTPVNPKSKNTSKEISNIEMIDKENLPQNIETMIKQEVMNTTKQENFKQNFEKDFQLSTIQKVDRTMMTNIDNSILQLHTAKVGRNLEKDLHEENWKQRFHLAQSRSEFAQKMLEQTNLAFEKQ